MNLMNIMQMIKGGNPQKIIQQMLKDNCQFANNPIVMNMLDMAKSGDISGIEQIGRNIAKEKGIDFDKEFSKFKNQFPLR